MNRVLKEFLISAVLFFGILFAALQVDWLKVLHLRPTIVEDKLSEWTWKFISTQINETTDDEVRLPVDTLMRELCLANGIDTASVHLVVCSDNVQNAFATVGRHLVIYTSLIGMMENEAQLCAVLSHELAHLQLGHIKSGVRRQAAINAVLIMLSSGRSTGQMNDLLGDLISNSFSRASENAADAEGARYMHAAHLDPMEMAAMLDKLSELEEGGLRIPYFSDHDDSKKRAKRIRGMQFDDNGPYRQILSPGTWEKMKGRGKM